MGGKVMIGPILPLPRGIKKCFIKDWPNKAPADLVKLVEKSNGGNRGVRLDHYASLDPDSAAARSLMAQWERQGILTPTVAWKTASGAPRRLYLRPEGLRESLTIQTLNFQLRTGNGLQDVIPPSYVKDPEKKIDGSYSWLPGHDPESIEVAPLPDAILSYFQIHGRADGFKPEEKPKTSPAP
jgi:hypothetical protein